MLKEITDRLLRTEYPAEQMRAAADMHALFSGITKVSDNSQNEEDRRETSSVGGTAISPRDAARCMFDYMRTINFLSGVRAAVIEAQRRFPAQTIHVLYAGCGPFAPLALPLTTEFTGDEVQFTLLDIHQRSLDAVRLIVEKLELSGFVRDYIRCDAASYQHPREADAPHIVVTETMQKALAKEPQVAITANLVPQLRAGGLLIPQQITLRACLADLSREMTLMDADADPETISVPNRSRIELSAVFELTAESSRQVGGWQKEGDEDDAALCSPPVTLHVPQFVDEINALMILTEITIFDSIMLEDYDCGLSYPTVLEDVGRINGGEQIEFRYATGRHPGLRYRLI